jgi:hypothetical protein
MISSWNEWDSLKRVVVGDATAANWPVNDPVFNKESEKTTWKETPVPRGPVPQHIIEETNEDLAALATTLTGLGVEVVRPDPLNFQTHDGMYNYCPRDRLLVLGDTVVDTPMMYPCRDMELQCYHDILEILQFYTCPEIKDLCWMRPIYYDWVRTDCCTWKVPVAIGWHTIGYWPTCPPTPVLSYVTSTVEYTLTAP